MLKFLPSTTLVICNHCDPPLIPTEIGEDNNFVIYSHAKSHAGTAQCSNSFGDVFADATGA